ncbi:Hint domain-containing protein [Neptunicoccus cionae]|uniref:Hedgehog/Intein (Hint) domain-containing protein n=1 Tax=Neptunicoccus cionae TaxID=2035344 RepID=A0A916VTX9_9RHOB|nr:Hint domain-containing protein [Amylibacter cionae]GGA34073.1 hypothetical protein GCM10011498_39050 [Amylibacter cionae]
MAEYTVGIYNFDPFFEFSKKEGETSVYGGPANSTGTATITDNEAGIKGATLEDDSSGETATANVTIDGNTSTGTEVRADDVWTIQDMSTGETFQIVTFHVKSGDAKGHYTLSEKPLSVGTTYRIVEFDKDPEVDSGGPAFTYADYVSDLRDGTVEGTAGDDVIDGTYTGDPEDERVDNNDSLTEQPIDSIFSWQAQGADELDVSSGVTDTVNGVQVDISFVDDGNSDTISLEHGTQYVGDDPSFDPTSGIEIRGVGGVGNTSTTTIDFTGAVGSGMRDDVENVRFFINDLDSSSWQDVVSVKAYDADGNEISVEFTAFGNETISGSVITAGSGNDTEAEADGSVMIEIDGPVSYIVIDYDNLGSGGQKMLLSDIHFDAIPDGANADVIDAGAGNDSIDAGIDDDTVFGGSGSDTINASKDDDTLYGGDDADVFQLGDNLGNDSIVGGEGGTDSDTIDGSALTSGMDVTYTGNEAGTINDDTGQIATFSEIEDLVLTDQDDTVDASATTESKSFFGGAGADSLTGGSAADTLTGGEGDDTLAGGGGADTLYGGSGMDYADYSSSGSGVTVNLTTATGAGGDAEGDVYGGIDGLIGSAFDDVLTGYDGQGPNYTNIFYGGAGNDVLTGLAGDDTLFGGDDEDTFILGDGFGNDTISGGEGGGDNDTVDASALTTGVDVNYTGDEAGTLTDGSDTATFSNMEVLVLTEQADTVDASASNSGVSIEGGGGDDVIVGSAGGDSLDGGAGADSIDGGDGADTVYGGAGADTLSGGGGADTVYGGGDVDMIDGGAAADLLYGGDGADSITGGDGTDTLYGDAGSDVLYLGRSDLAYGGDGDDTFTIDVTQDQSGPITIFGGEGGETGAGDTIDFAGQLDKGSKVITDADDAAGGMTGYAFLLDGTRVNFSQIEGIICFARGTRILTHSGETAIEDLAEGDQILTLDNGLQQIRWIGSRKVPAVREFAPIVISKGVLGNHTDLVVSPQHRVLVSGPVAELLFCEQEVLVPAKHLLSWDGVSRAEMPEVEYFHMLFDTHQIVHANGAQAESFHPGEQALDAVSQDARDEIFSLFPELETAPAAYGPSARFSLKAHEAELLGQGMA